MKVVIEISGKLYDTILSDVVLTREESIALAMCVYRGKVVSNPETGHWIDCDDSDDYSADGYDCSVCGCNAEYATDYCPNCGARMTEPQERSDKP